MVANVLYAHAPQAPHLAPPRHPPVTLRPPLPPLPCQPPLIQPLDLHLHLPRRLPCHTHTRRPGRGCPYSLLPRSAPELTPSWKTRLSTRATWWTRRTARAARRETNTSGATTPTTTLTTIRLTISDTLSHEFLNLSSICGFVFLNSH